MSLSTGVRGPPPLAPTGPHPLSFADFLPDWTTDIPTAAFGPGQHCMLVTAPSPPHRYLMKVITPDCG